MKMRRILFLIFILLSLVGCAQKPTPSTPQLMLPIFPSPPPIVLAKLTDLNDYEVNAWLIKLNDYKKQMILFQY